MEATEERRRVELVDQCFDVLATGPELPGGEAAQVLGRKYWGRVPVIDVIVAALYAVRVRLGADPHPWEIGP